MRLIDADALIKDIELSRNNNIHREARIKMNHETEHRHFLKIVAEQPKAFDKDKVRRELIELRNEEIYKPDSINKYVEARTQGRYSAFLDAIRIVEKGGTE